MNRLTPGCRAQILHLLCEGNSIRSVTRLTGVSKKAVSRLMVEAGEACAWYQDRVLRNLTCKRVQVDEIWAFVYAKQKNVPRAKKAPPQAGDAWTWTAIDADTKLDVYKRQVLDRRLPDVRMERRGQEDQFFPQPVLHAERAGRRISGTRCGAAG